MTTITEGRHNLEWLLSEANGQRSRGVLTVTVSGGVALKSGTLLGVIAANSAVAAAVAGNTGNGAMGSVTVGANAKPGVYKLTIVEPGANAGEFVVEDPDGVTVGNGTVAAAFSAGGLAFTLADGATDFAAGDQFTITVSGTGKAVAYNDAGTAGEHTAVAILMNDTSAVDGDYQMAVIDKDAEVFGALLIGSNANGIADLARVGIKVR